jgi:hypothetical protein
MRKYPAIAQVGLAISMFAFANGALGDQPPAGLPLLPPPEKAQGPATATVVPVEFRIAIEDLEKQMLRSLVQKIDPKAEPKLPIVVKGNEPEFALGAEGGPPDAPKPLPEPGKDVVAPRPQLIPREPGTRPRLDRLASRPLVAGMIARVAATFDLTYRMELRSLKISFVGNTMICEVAGGFHCEGKAPPQGPPAPPNVRDLGIKMTVTKNLEWNESGKLELREGTSKVWIDPDAPIVGFPRLDIERIVRLNGVLALMGGTLDRELMKRLSTENLPDLAIILPSIKQKMPFLTVSELTAYPIRGDDRHVYFSFEVGLIPANKAGTEPVKIAAKNGPFPEPKVRGRISFDKDGKPETKLDPMK